MLARRRFLQFSGAAVASSLLAPALARAVSPSSGISAANAAIAGAADFAALEQRYGELRQPVLLIWGDHDPTIPIEIGERIASVLPCRRFVRLFTLHRPHQTLPDTVTAEMQRFLSGGIKGCRE